ncbi:hypothetical protein [Arthrobacter psychrolactophilus]
MARSLPWSVVVGYLIASVTVPLYWAKSIGSQIGDQWGNSIPLGMFYGFVFSFIPVLVAWQAHHRKLNKWVRISLVVLGIILTIPNLLTLGVLFGQPKPRPTPEASGPIAPTGSGPGAKSSWSSAWCVPSSSLS